MLGIHRIDRTLETTLNEIRDNSVSHTVRSFGGTDDRNVAGPEEHFERRLAGLPLGRHILDGMPPLRGSFGALTLYDVAEQILLMARRPPATMEPSRREPVFK